MKSFKQWREFQEPDTLDEEEQINANMTYLKSLLGKTSGRADPVLLGQIKNKIAQAKERFAKDASLGEQRYEDLSLKDQYDFFLGMLEAVVTIALPENWRSGKRWTAQKVKDFGVEAERQRKTVPNPAPTPPMPPSGLNGQF